MVFGVGVVTASTGDRSSRKLAQKVSVPLIPGGQENPMQIPIEFASQNSLSRTSTLSVLIALCIAPFELAMQVFFSKLFSSRLFG